MNFLYYYFNFVFTYILFSFIGFCLDSKFEYLEYKIQEKDPNKILKTYVKIFPTVMKNVVLYSFPYFYFISFFENYRNKSFSVRDTATDLISAHLLIDIFFYSIHRFFHLPFMYKYHKKHHELKAPIAFGALYMDKLDLYGNLVSVTVPLVILSSTYVTIQIFITTTIINTLFVAHGSYKGISENHDIHHEKFVYNYGIDIFMDRLFGTKY